VNVNDLHDQRTLGARVADAVANTVGSWPFILIQSGLLLAWIAANVYFALNPGVLKAFDPYPFILLNLALSFQAAYSGPIVMMSQNRQSEKDRLTANNDYQCNLKAEQEIRLLMEHLKAQDHQMEALHQHLLSQDEILKKLVRKG
jgi:uncharacterized membrane protein